MLFFVLASALFTWPLVTHMSDTLPDWGDAADSAKNLGSIAMQLRTDPLHLYESLGFQVVGKSDEPTGVELIMELAVR